MYIYMFGMQNFYYGIDPFYNRRPKYNFRKQNATQNKLHKITDFSGSKVLERAQSTSGMGHLPL